MNMTTQVQAKPAPTLPFTPVRTNLLQRKCVCGSTPGPDGECAECRKQRLSVQRYAVNQSEPALAPPIVHDALRSPGQPLDPAIRAFMEPRFGHDFSQVRVHTDAIAAESAHAVNALAYTVGRDVVFGAGQYAPETGEGQRILAHELTHTLQQGGGMHWVPDKLETTDPRDAAEREAETVARAIVQGHSFTPALNERLAIARQAPAPAPVCANPGVSRTVDLQPVFFKSSAADPAPTGVTWPSRLAQAQTVWQKLGVTFTGLSSIEKVDATNKSAGKDLTEYNAIRATQSGSGIEVFMVDNDIAFLGGGGTINKGSDAAQVVLSDRGTSSTLLAHELGHVLGLDHPPGGADPGTIMEPSGSNSSPNPTKNTMANYTRITWPAGSGSICLTPDP